MPDIRPVELFIPEIKELIQQKNFDELQILLSEMNPIDLADGFSHFSSERQLLMLKLLKPDRTIEVFEELDIPQQEFLIQHLEDQTLSPLLEGIPPEITAKLFKKLPEKTVKKMELLMKKEKVDHVHHRLEYDPNTVGAIMQTEVIGLNSELTTKAALALVQARTRVNKGGEIHSIYITNGNGKLLGGLTLRTLIAAPADIKVKNLMSPVSLIKIQANMEQEEASKIFSRYKLIAAPVVDEENHLIGIVTVDDMITVIQEEATADIQKLGAVEALDKPYFQMGFREMIKKRAPWLTILLIGEMLTATAMGFFEHEIAKAVVLALFIPLIISSGGNSGSQASTLIVRALALKEINLRDWWRVTAKEFVTGLALGLILGVIGFFRIYLWSLYTPIYGPHYFLVALTVGLTLVAIVLWGTLSGSILPIFLRRLGLDPAVASAPFVATLVDVTGLLIYFTVALFILQGTLL